MFTGIIEALGRVEEPRDAGGRFRIALPEALAWGFEVGESVAVNGVCLTVAEAWDGGVGFDLADETCRVTTLGDLGPGAPINLERPLRLDGRLGGHLVLGHVDGVGTVVGRRAEGTGVRLGVSLVPELRPFLIPKGSVAVDGVSLTVADLDATGFSVALIPHTLSVTTLGTRRVGDRVNLEMDVIGKYVRGFVGEWEVAR